MSAATINWSDDQFIYRQILDQLIARIIDGTFAEGELLPSVRQMAKDYGVSMITTVKVVTELSRDNIVEKRRGIGFEIRQGVRSILLQRERRRFLEAEWPEFYARMKQLGISIDELPLDR